MATRKPCPICKKPKTHLQDQIVCYECMKLVEDGKRYRKEQKRRASKMHHCELPRRFHDMPRIEHQPVSRFGYGHGGPSDSDRLRITLLQIAMMISEERTNEERKVKGVVVVGAPKLFVVEKRVEDYQRGLALTGPRLMDAKVACKLRRLLWLIQRCVRHAYAEGHENGHDLLMRLHNGSLSIDEMNKRVATVNNRNAERET